MRVVSRALGGIGRGVRARRRVFLAIAAGVFVLDVLTPPLLLSVVRKPVDYFTFNPWLPELPGYLLSGRGSLAHRLDRAWGLALFWFSSDNPYGIEWGFAVTTADLARFALMALLVGAYFALWVHRRTGLAGTGFALGASGQGGVLGAVGSVFGLATSGCSVMGCGAPVLPVVGLAFVGLSSTTLAWLSGLSTVATLGVLAGMVLGVLYLGFAVGGPPGPTSRGPTR